MSMLTIRNSGQAIAETNYWGGEHAASGLCYLSWNAGAARLLVPPPMRAAIREMRTAREVIVSRGPWHEQGGRDALELMFEDGSDAPYCVHILAEQCDRMLPETDQGGGFVVAVWTRGGMQLRLPGKYREVAEIPCLAPWVVQ